MPELPRRASAHLHQQAVLLVEQTLPFARRWRVIFG